MFVLISVACLNRSGFAEVWKSSEFNCSIKLPLESGWTRLPAPSPVTQFSIRSPDQSKAINFSVTPTGNLSAEKFVAGFKKKFFAQATGKIRIEEQIQLAGRTAHRMRDVLIVDGQERFVASALVINDGVAYQIAAIGVGSDPVNDPAVKQCLESFTFLSAEASARTAARQAALQKFGPMAGTKTDDPQHDRMVNMIADLTFLVTVLIVIGWAVLKMVREVTARRPPPLPKNVNATKPPPLPPAMANRSAHGSVVFKVDVN
jgi:hypothetical protein